jgi:uridine kinase
MWIRHPGRSKNVVRIRGAEGSGKTMISQEIAERCAEHGLLAASFFFSRSSSDRNHTRVRRFCTTLAYQLALNILELKEGIEKVIEADPSVVQKANGAQFKKLIMEPIVQSELSFRHDASSLLMGWMNVWTGHIKPVFCVVYSFLWSKRTFPSASLL